MKALIFAFTFMAAILSGQVAAQTSSDLGMVLLNQNPYPAEPGGNVDIEVELQNNGLGEATNLAVEISPSGPFHLVKGDRVKTYPRIGARSSVKLTYTLLVDDSALAGDYDLEFKLYNPVTPSQFQKEEVGITVIGETKLIIGHIFTTPDVLEPGGSAVISVNIENVGTGDARQLEVKMNSTSEHILPVLSGGLVYVGDLGAGENTTVDLSFNIDPDADQTTYLAALTFIYKDENNQQSVDTFSIGIPVEGNVRFEVVSIEPNFQDGTLDVEIANKGTGDASSVEARFKVNGETVGVSYLSQLAATKKTTLSYPLVMSGEATLEITYVEPKLAQKTLVKDLGRISFAAPGGDGVSTFVFLIVIGVIGYFVWKRFFRKKKK